MKLSFFGTLTILAIASGSFLHGADEEKKKKGPASLADRTLKRYESVELTDDQVAKIKELATTAQTKLAGVKEKADLTPEQRKARQDAIKKAKDEGKEKKDFRDAVSAAVTLTEDQKAAQAESKKIMGDFNKSVAGLLTEEQKAAMKAKNKKPKSA